MNNKLIAATALLLACALCIAAPGAQALKRSVQITITNITTSSGTIVLSAHDSEESFKKRKPVQTVRVPATVPSVTIELSLESGECAFCVFSRHKRRRRPQRGLYGNPQRALRLFQLRRQRPARKFQKAQSRHSRRNGNVCARDSAG